MKEKINHLNYNQNNLFFRMLFKIGIFFNKTFNYFKYNNVYYCIIKIIKIVYIVKKL